MKMMLLCFLFATPVFAMQEAPEIFNSSDQVKTDEGCTLSHPSTLTWRKPAKASFSGTCANGLAQGYGWYKFNLASDGAPTWAVELFIEFNAGVTSNNYLYVKMFTNGNLLLENFMDLNNHSLDFADCLQIPECARTADVLKNGTKPTPPQPAPPQPAPPERPAPPAPPEQPAPPVDPLKRAQVRFVSSWQAGLQVLLERSKGDATVRQAITTAMNEFYKNYPSYAANICQRNKRNLLNCAIFQYDNASVSLERLVNGDSITAIYFPVAGFVSRAKECQRTRTNTEFLTCYANRLDKDLDVISKNHPNGAAFGSKALKNYAKALAMMDQNAGPALTAATLENYEHFLRYLMEQAERPWDN
ncbi:hypothetical protein [Bdellovibrio reynosensis]|uniref:Uncharacterized protein n=1 Tax=Bdellovibrio reynosensis TaxID=2835041 RepID=A0ABY4CFT9_9BACT|nr:hypothetical protein [Bdellovibrio reynosensis]UOF02536.1 hypothetical protein MNR06_06170 [Bdellovibrio reynosensis]